LLSSRVHLHFSPDILCSIQKFRSLGARTPSNLDTSPSSYVGGQTDLAGKGETALVFAFKGASIGDQQAASFLVLKHLLGSSSPSLNGVRPGDGASSYLGLLASQNQGNAWFKSVSSFNYSLSDSGLFGVYATARAGGNGDKLFSTIHSSLTTSLPNNINDQQVAAAKARAKAAILSADSRHQLLHVVGQQASTSANKVHTPSQIAAAVDAVSTQQIKDLSKQVFSSAPAVVAAGDVSKVPRV
jgi:predicted Zn-dependent peptidase